MSNVWLKVRIGILFLMLLVGILSPRSPEEQIEIPLALLLPVCAFAGIFFCVGIIIMVRLIYWFRGCPIPSVDWRHNILDFNHFPNAITFLAAAVMCQALGFWCGSIYRGGDVPTLFTGGICLICLAMLAAVKFVTRHAYAAQSCEQNSGDNNSPTILARRTKRVTAIFMLILGPLLVCGGILWAGHTVSFLRSAARTEGVVIRIEKRQNQDGTSFFPVVQYQDEAGQPFEFRAGPGRSPSSAYSVNDKVPVAYRPGKVADAKLVSFLSLWLIPMIVCINGGILTLVGWFFMRAARRQYHPTTTQDGVETS